MRARWQEKSGRSLGARAAKNKRPFPVEVLVTVTLSGHSVCNGAKQAFARKTVGLKGKERLRKVRYNFRLFRCKTGTSRRNLSAQDNRAGFDCSVGALYETAKPKVLLDDDVCSDISIARSFSIGQFAYR